MVLDTILQDPAKLSDLSKEVALVTSGKDSDLRAAWRSFCQRSFWTRVWILQELALGNDVVLQAGASTMKLEYFLSVFCLCARLAASRTSEYRQHEDAVELMADVYGIAHDFIDCVLRSKQRPYDLDVLIYDTQRLQASWKSDKIYGLLGLARDTEELDVKVDYKNSFEDNCRDLAKCLLMRKSASALSYTRVLISGNEVPSWANIYCLLNADSTNKLERKLRPISGKQL